MLSAVSRQRQRATRACDFCHSRGLKCRRGAYNQYSYNLAIGVVEETALSNVKCLTCSDYGVECTMIRPLRKRGRRKATDSTTERDISNYTEANGARSDIILNDRDTELLRVPRPSKTTKSHLLDEVKFGSQDVIRRLVQIYHDTMYPKYA